MIGFFVNTLVMRGDLSGDPGFRELLRRVRRTAIEAYTHQDLPFERLVSVAHRDRDAEPRAALPGDVRPPECTVPSPAIARPLAHSPRLSSGTSKFDLTLFATEVPEGLRLTMEYSTDLFDAATVDRMLAHYRILLEEIIAHPDQPIGALPMLTEEERTQLLVGWNSEGTDLATVLDAPENDDLGFLLYDVFRRRSRPMNSATRSGNGRAPEAAVPRRAHDRSRRIRRRSSGASTAGSRCRPNGPRRPSP